jgi:Flp pilus assembly protein TadG
MVEFAFVLPIFLALVFGTFDLGRAVFMQAQLTLAVQEAVRIASLSSGKTCSGINAQLVNAVTQRPLLGSASVSCSPSSLTYGTNVTVTATAPFQLVLPSLIPGVPSFTLSATAQTDVR